jgi:hypothetical protein
MARRQQRGAPFLLLQLLLLSTLSQAAEPEFKTAIVTAARVYERETGAVSIGGVRTGAVTAWTSRVTVALDGMWITGEWVPKTTISATAKDFPRGSDVAAAITRSQLLLKHPTDGSVVTAKIVKRERPPAENADERD